MESDSIDSELSRGLSAGITPCPDVQILVRKFLPRHVVRTFARVSVAYHAVEVIQQAGTQINRLVHETQLEKTIQRIKGTPSPFSLINFNLKVQSDISIQQSELAL